MHECREGYDGCVGEYVREGGPVCWDMPHVQETCRRNWGVTCDDCGRVFCLFSPKRPAMKRVGANEHNLCAMCSKPYAVHRAHWTYHTYWAIQERKRAERNRERMHELRLRHDANVARMANNDANPF